MAREIAAVNKLSETEAVRLIEAISPRDRSAAKPTLKRTSMTMKLKRHKQLYFSFFQKARL